MAALGKKFFERNTLQVARELLGKKIVRVYRGKRIDGIITETEAYMGHNDKASHASRGKTPRTRVMFGEAGKIYVYLVYGMHYCLNIVTERKDFPAAVLIRGIDGVNGPGRVCKFLKIDKKLNDKSLSRKNGLWIAGVGPLFSIGAGARIGVNYSGPIWSKKHWRFWIKGDTV